MATKKFSQVTTKTSLTDSDYTVGYNGTTNYKWSLISLYNYIKSKLDSVYLKLTGGALTGGLEFKNYIGYGVSSYTNVVNYKLYSSQTGAFVITHPKGFAGTMNSISIQGYDYYTGKGSFNLIVGGFQSTSNDWDNVKAIGDNVYFDKIRVGYNAGVDKCVIILGDVDTRWNHTFFGISLIAGYSQYTGLTITSGWNVELVTDLSPYTDIIDVPLFINGVNYAGRLLAPTGNNLTVDMNSGVSFAEVECGGVFGTLGITVNNLLIGSKLKLYLMNTDAVTDIILTINTRLPDGTSKVCYQVRETWQIGGNDHMLTIDGYYTVGALYKAIVNLKPYN